MKLLTVLTGLPMAAYAVTVGPLPPSEFADTEVTAHHPLVQEARGFCGLDFRLTFNGTASNNVEVAFGQDEDGDGALAPLETDVVVGWECGRYFVERFRTGERIEEPNVGATDAGRSLSWHYAVRKGGRAFRGFAATNEAGAAFASVSTNAPAWLYDRGWNLMRLAARGTDVQGEKFAVDVRTAGTFIYLR